MHPSYCQQSLKLKMVFIHLLSLYDLLNHLKNNQYVLEVVNISDKRRLGVSDQRLPSISSKNPELSLNILSLLVASTTLNTSISFACQFLSLPISIINTM